MKKKELSKVVLDFFHAKQDEVISLKYIFSELKLTTHPLKMLCMDILSDLLADDYITEVDKNKYKLNITIRCASPFMPNVADARPREK